ncbi:MAG: YdeI/OmpD-associated family protein [Acidobacteriia bacterium]|nr:YdeI/OmpD-associated family protein [Terriglobia bacterium]
MGTRDKRIDAYIAKSADFAQPILRNLREIVHEGCPDVEETMRWSLPSFMYKGILCGMAAFKQHCALGFWKGKLIIDPKMNKSVDAMGQFGRITSMQDLPSKRVLMDYVRKAAQLNEQGIKVPKQPKPAGEKKKLAIPPYFMAAVKKNKKALATFEGFPYSKKKDYVEWVTEAKTDETRDRRLQTSVEWMAEGKSRNWKYERC